MKIQYDKVADAMYIYLKEGKIHQTIPVSNYVIVDVDKEGKTIGIELLDASTMSGFDPEKNIFNGVPVEDITTSTPAVVWA